MPGPRRARATKGAKTAAAIRHSSSAWTKWEGESRCSPGAGLLCRRLSRDGGIAPCGRASRMWRVQRVPKGSRTYVSRRRAGRPRRREAPPRKHRHGSETPRNGPGAERRERISIAISAAAAWSDQDLTVRRRRQRCARQGHNIARAGVIGAALINRCGRQCAGPLASPTPKADFGSRARAIETTGCIARLHLHTPFASRGGPAPGTDTGAFATAQPVTHEAGQVAIVA